MPDQGHVDYSILNERWSIVEDSLIASVYNTEYREKHGVPVDVYTEIARMHPDAGDTWLLTSLPDLFRVACTLNIALRHRSSHWLATAVAAIAKNEARIESYVVGRVEPTIAAGLQPGEIRCFSRTVGAVTVDWTCVAIRHRYARNTGAQVYDCSYALRSIPSLLKMANNVLSDLRHNTVISPRTINSVKDFALIHEFTGFEYVPLNRDRALDAAWGLDSQR